MGSRPRRSRAAPSGTTAGGEHERPWGLDQAPRGLMALLAGDNVREGSCQGHLMHD